METEQAEQCQQFAPLSVTKEIYVVPFIMLTLWGHREMSLDYRHEERCSLKPLLLLYGMFKVVLDFFPFYCVTAPMKQKMKLSHCCELKFPVNQC